MVVSTKFLVFVLLLCRLLASSGAAAASAPGGTRTVSWFFPEGSEDGCASGPANGTAEISIGDASLSRPVVSCLVPGLHTHYLFCQVMPANATSVSRNETIQAVYEEEYHTSEDYLDGPLVHAGCSEAPHTGSRCCFL